MSTAKKIAAAGLCVIGLRMAVLAGAGRELREWFTEATSDGRLITASVSLELGQRDGEVTALTTPPITEHYGGFTVSPAPTDAAEPSAAASTPTQAPATEPETEEQLVETTIYKGLSINNGTSFDVDAAELLSEGTSLKLPAEGPQILIIHTHSSESYQPDHQNVYELTDNDRTEDTRYNVVRVGDELAAALESYGLSVLHDREIYDYPSYTGSYTRSGEAIEQHLKENPDIAVVIDLHRDALGSDGVVYKTKAEVDGECSSQVMLLVGSNESGLYHPEWEQNLKFALCVQQAMIDKYPTLARPVALVPQRYNQQLTTGSIILEVGSSGNTLSEALAAVRLFADSAGPVLVGLIEAE